MSDLQIVIWVLVLTAVGALLFGPGMWSESWGWDFLDRFFKKKTPTGPTKPRGPDAK